MSPSDYEEHPGPLRKGDRIVLQIHRWILPRADRAPGPQCFEVMADQAGDEPVPLRRTEQYGAVMRYRCNWRPSECLT